MTLTELFENHYLPKLQDKNSTQTTIGEYARTVKRWDQLLGRPNVAEITARHIQQFKTILGMLPGTHGETLKQNTVRKYLRHLRPLLMLAGPRDSKNSRGLSLLTEIPELNPPKEHYRNADDAFTREEIVAWIDAAKVHRAPDIAGIKAGLWWECFLTFIYNSGVRVGTLLAATWDWIDFEESTFCSVKKQGVKTAYDLTLNAEAVETLRRIKKVSDNPLLFPWEYHRRTLYVHARRQQAVAGIPEDRRFGFHAIRKYFGSQLATENLAAATQALGHSTSTVTTRYYMNRKQVSAPVINRIQPIGRAIEARAMIPANAPTVLPSTPVNHVDDSSPFGSVMIVYR